MASDSRASRAADETSQGAELPVNTEGVKRHAPATLRNRDAIVSVLAKELPKSGTVLEIASGSGEHVIYFAERFPDLTWKPTDSEPEALVSISAYRDEYGGGNCLPPVQIDASKSAWQIAEATAVLCINMAHISPWEATLGLFAGAARLLTSGAPLILYGPYFEEGVEPAPSNVEFDRSLRSRDERWGIRHLAQVDDVANEASFSRSARYEMPANNLTLVYRKQALS